ncbi:hypothetical protein NM688_g4094 [Phlebia brevispora]|uniref:Uncharacterized protein n=1 Tax=Phlebia brevispora TaxID=194682 RepID=A0ACC1T3V0_9APHY|nr:hypothetical protein NM688_g4094 [Phlebia brevispora]
MAVKTTRRRQQYTPFNSQAFEPEGASDDSDKGDQSEEEREEEVPDAEGRHPTPVRMQAPSDHDRESIHPYVREDLKCAKVVGFYTWTESVLGLPSTKIVARAREIAKLRWFEDRIIQDALVDYCRGTTEKARYDPFVHLVNRVIELARGKLSGVGVYPVKDFCIANNSDRVVQTIPEHGGLGAKRRPDFLGLPLAKAAKLYTPKGSVHWSDILCWGELKQVTILTEPLDKERQARGLSALDDSGFPVGRSKTTRGKAGKSGKSSKRSGLFADKPTRIQARKRTTKASPVEPEVQSARSAPRIRVGRKRLAEDDLLAGLELGSSGKRRNPWGKTNELYVGGEAAVQSGSYALELLSCTYGTRVHCFSFVVKDDKLTLWYYDASGVVYTKECISLVADFEVFASVMVGIASCTCEQFGTLPPTVMEPSAASRHVPPEHLGRYKLTMTHPVSKTDVTVTLSKSLFTQYTLTGRRSFLYTIKTTPSVSSKDMIMKFSYQVCTRKAEQDLVAIARTAGVKHLPRIHMWGELWKLSDGIRKIFYRKSKGAAEYEDRTLRAIVYTQYASIKELFTHSCELIPVMVDQMIDCLHDLRYKANMLHRDISVSNIMYQVREGRYYFILIDFDMAIAVPREGESSYVASSNHRTGTLPFMAYELIFNASRSHAKNWKPIPHLLRHDYESLFWLSLWCILTLLTKGLRAEHAKDLLDVAKQLERGELSQIAGYKAILSMTTICEMRIDLPPAAEPLIDWFTAWNIILIRSVTIVQMWKALHGTDRDASGNTAVARLLESWRDEGKDDWETAGGIYTRDKLKAVLSSAFSIPTEYKDSAEVGDSDVESEHDVAIFHDVGLAVAPKSEVTDKLRRSTRNKRTKPAELVIPLPENDIRSRLRPRRPRA